MKIFDADGKVNFVDKNNVFVGYDQGQGCCEWASYFISSKEEEKEREDDDESAEFFEPYVFDTSYFEEAGEGMSEGQMVRFKLTAPGLPDFYLHLFNCHNGYYGHGFKANIGDTSWQSGTL